MHNLSNETVAANRLQYGLEGACLPFAHHPYSYNIHFSLSASCYILSFASSLPSYVACVYILWNSLPSLLALSRKLVKKLCILSFIIWNTSFFKHRVRFTYNFIAHDAKWLLCMCEMQSRNTQETDKCIRQLFGVMCINRSIVDNNVQHKWYLPFFPYVNCTFQGLANVCAYYFHSHSPILSVSLSVCLFGCTIIKHSSSLHNVSMQIFAYNA